MASLEAFSPRSQRSFLFLAIASTAFLAFAFLAFDRAKVNAKANKIELLHIGTSGNLSTEGGAGNEKSSLDTLQSFIQDETGLKNEIIKQKNWQELAEKMSKGELEVGVFQGYEYAWAKEKYHDLRPLAVAVNVYVYPVAYVVTKRNNKAANFAGLQGQSFCLVNNPPGYLQLFVDRQCQALGKKTETFFSKITARDNFEDALDDVVDGVVNATVADRATIEAYKRRKPGRFNQLKSIAQSQPFPPPVIAYYGKFLDESTRQRFRKGLLGASNKEKGRTMLTLFRLTGFQTPPDDFSQILASTRKAYPLQK